MTGTSLIATMAERYSMEPVQFAKTVRKTVMPSQHTDEEFAAFMMVAYEYGLNPITREIFAYPKKGGGINPVVSIDGWVHLVNSHPQCDGFEFAYLENPDRGKPPVAVTCTVWRKDRHHPIVITEYYAECVRATEPWNTMPRRMLRHKAMKEAARYAFGYSGITDEDEARDIAGSVQQIQKPIILDAQVLDDLAAGADPSTGSSTPPTPPPDEPGDPVGASPAPAGLRREAIDRALRMAGEDRPEQERLESLTHLVPMMEDQLPADFVKQLGKTVAKVIKGELGADKAGDYLERLP
jgi:phage recombination protein Bet